MLILLAAAMALTPASRLQRDAEDKARGEVTDLFRALCPEQCVLLSLQARVGFGTAVEFEVTAGHLGRWEASEVVVA